MTQSRFELEPTYRAIVAVARPAFFGMGYKFTLKGRHHVPRWGGAIMAVNHTAYPDFLFAGLAARRKHRWVRFMAKKSIWSNSKTGPIMRGCKHIPVDRHAGLLRHPGGALLQLLDLEAARHRRLGVDPDDLAVLERLDGKPVGLRAGVPVDRDVGWQPRFTGLTCNGRSDHRR